MQEKKTLTFVVPAYNMTEYLERCVMSLIAAKRNDDIEVLIVDDGSSLIMCMTRLANATSMW